MNLPLANIHTKQMVCNCEAHAGDTVTQLEGTLPNGKPVVIMQDWRGFHVAIGARNCLGEWQYTQPVTAAQAERMIREAAQS